ncbi:MAG: hypothetical protein PHT62_08060 [Desulfotomaculaceae bacterium]|nr:hypothetical protein [Desulfotomaculaceae bacterium]
MIYDNMQGFFADKLPDLANIKHQLREGDLAYEHSGAHSNTSLENSAEHDHKSGGTSKKSNVEGSLALFPIDYHLPCFSCRLDLTCCAQVNPDDHRSVDNLIGLNYGTIGVVLIAFLAWALSQAASAQFWLIQSKALGFV